MLRQTKKRPKELVDVVVPLGAQHVWDWFWNLDDASDGKPITHAEMLAWAGLTGEILRPWEVHALRSMSKARRQEAEKIERSGV